MSLLIFTFEKTIEMFEASFSGILKAILIVLLLYFAFKMLFRFLGPFLLRYAMKKVGKKFKDQFSGTTNTRDQKPLGKVSIDKKENTRKPSNKNVGEYIDYEEID